MAVRVDPEGNETRALVELADLRGQRVLEVGCGDDRLTWRYAGSAAHVTAVDSWEEGIARARQHLPGELQGRVEFYQAAFPDVAAVSEPSSFDRAILAWSL
jgi:ubiquinone/menaquinone biosynthesis C-methylase UbiE